MEVLPSLCYEVTHLLKQVHSIPMDVMAEGHRRVKTYRFIAVAEVVLCFPTYNGPGKLKLRQCGRDYWQMTKGFSRAEAREDATDTRKEISDKLKLQHCDRDYWQMTKRYSRAEAREDATDACKEISSLD